MPGPATPPPPRLARLVLVNPDGQLVGSLPAIPVATPWWTDAAPVVAAVREHHGIDATLLRMLESDGEWAGGTVTYLAEVAAPVASEPWPRPLDDHPLRLPYARPGGPAADLRWAEAALAPKGVSLTGAPRQMRTWHLSSIWCLETTAGRVWLKHVPPFFAHEGAIIQALGDAPVPRLLAHDGARILIADIPGEEAREAPIARRKDMISLLVQLQRRFLGRTGELRAIGLPDWRAAPLTRDLTTLVRRHRSALPANIAAALERFLDDLPTRFAGLAACGIPDTLVHGDFHAGNLRDDGETLTLIDWGDSGIGHPMLDQPAFLAGAAEAEAAELRRHWAELWRTALPGSDPDRAATLVAPLATARQALIYQNFTDQVEPDEHRYHAGETLQWLEKTAAIVSSEPV